MATPDTFSNLIFKLDADVGGFKLALDDIGKEFLKLRGKSKAFKDAAATVQLALLEVNQSARQLASGATLEDIFSPQDLNEIRRSIAVLSTELREGADSFAALQQAGTGALSELGVEVDATTEATKKLRSNFGRTSRSGRLTSGVLIDFTRVIQDLPFGILGVANNIEQLTASSIDLVEAADDIDPKVSGGRKALELLGDTLKGPGGILVAVSVVSSAFVFFRDDIEKLTASLVGGFGALKDYAGVVERLANLNQEDLTIFDVDNLEEAEINIAGINRRLAELDRERKRLRREGGIGVQPFGKAASSDRSAEIRERLNEIDAIAGKLVAARQDLQEFADEESRALLLSKELRDVIQDIPTGKVFRAPAGLVNDPNRPFGVFLDDANEAEEKIKDIGDAIVDLPRIDLKFPIDEILVAFGDLTSQIEEDIREVLQFTFEDIDFGGLIPSTGPQRLATRGGANVARQINAQRARAIQALNEERFGEAIVGSGALEAAQEGLDELRDSFEGIAGAGKSLSSNISSITSGVTQLARELLGLDRATAQAIQATGKLAESLVDGSTAGVVGAAASLVASLIGLFRKPSERGSSVVVEGRFTGDAIQAALNVGVASNTR